MLLISVTGTITQENDTYFSLPFPSKAPINLSKSLSYQYIAETFPD